MKRHDDFSEATRQALAERCGFRCSFFGCGKPTVGPSQESAVAVSSTGMACHIAAASPGRGSRRYVSEMTPAERSDISNGIWMCYTHGKLIDTDAERFSTDLLKKWKQLAENIARIMQTHNCTYPQALDYLNLTDFIPQKIAFNGVRINNKLIGDAINDCGIAAILGKRAFVNGKRFYY